MYKNKFADNVRIKTFAPFELLMTSCVKKSASQKYNTLNAIHTLISNKGRKQTIWKWTSA